ncbi:MAG TPA: hypothetical protein VH440_00570, partial [Candidatus Limnocylindrales bacterium]
GVLIGVLLLFPAVATVFPDGHLPGPRFRLPVVITILLVAAATVLITIGPTRPGSDAAPNPLAIPGLPYEVADLGQALGGLSVLLAFLLAVAAVVVRFRRSRGVERAQMKWLLASMTVMAVLFPISWGTDYGPSDLLDLASVFSGALMPVAIGIAILRYRLYDIDRIISRTLGWAVLTAILVAVFAVVVVGSQAVLAPVTEGNTLAVAVSTLAAAALFQPLRRRVQGIVDRRFDRARVDRERTAAMFADRMRDEVAIATLTTDLQHTVDRTLRPSAQAIWLRTNAR